MAGDEVVIVAVLTPKEGKGDDVKRVLGSIAAGVEKHEPDCYQYEVSYQEDTGDYVVVEKYANMAAVENHRNQSHFTSAASEFGAVVAKPPDIKLLKVQSGFASRK